jgi:hypothetical protein
MVTVNNEFDRIRKETVVASFKAIFHNFLGETVGNYRRSESEQPVSRPRIELGASRIRKNTNHSMASLWISKSVPRRAVGLLPRRMRPTQKNRTKVHATSRIRIRDHVLAASDDAGPVICIF